MDDIAPKLISSRVPAAAGLTPLGAKLLNIGVRHFGEQTQPNIKRAKRRERDS
jgi:hypothetical protein